MGIKALRKIQLGREATPGTQVPATFKWRGGGILEDERETLFIEEDIGYLSGLDRTVVTKYGGRLVMDDVPVSYEMLPVLLSAGISKDSATADGVGTGYIYEHIAATDVPKEIWTYTVEGGDDAGAEYMAFSYVESMGITGEAGSQLQMNAEWVGRVVNTVTFTATAELPEIESIPFAMGKLYIDAATATIGTTQVVNTWLGMDLSIETGWKSVMTGDGSLYFSFIKQIQPEVTCDFTFEYNATAIAEIAAWRAQEARAIRMIWEGSTLTTEGTTYAKKTVIIDLAGKWETFSGLEDQDGNDTVTGTFRARMNASQGFYLKFIVVNALAALP